MARQHYIVHPVVLCAFVALVWAAPTRTSAAPVTAKRADAFVDAVGVNTHYGNAVYVGGNAYADRRIDAKLTELGVRHLRDHTWNDTGLKLVDKLYATRKIRTTLVLGETTRSPADLVKLLKQHPAYEAIEGLNEPDFTTRSYKGLTDDRKAAAFPATRAFQQELHAAVKGDAKTRHVLVLSPAMGRSKRSASLAPIPFDIAAMHCYPWAAPKQASHMPAAGLDDAIAAMAELRGDKPLWATETGYFNRSATDTRNVPESVAGKYVPRLLAEFFNRGVARTYLYELADQGKDPAAREQNFGLLRFDLTEKPAFTALKHLIRILQEPKAKPFTPGSLDFTLTPTAAGADVAAVHHTVLQKSDGTFYLLLWHDLPGFDRTTQKDITNAPLPATLSVNGKFEPAKVYRPSRSTTPVATHDRPGAVKLEIPDEVIIVELTPARR